MDDPKNDDSKFYWDWYKHEENLFTNRSNLFLVAESMLFAAVATLRAAPHPTLTAALLASLGIYVTVVWLRVSHLHHTRTRKPLREELHKAEGRRRAISESKDGKDISEIEIGWHKSYFWIGTIMPWGIFAAWIILLYNSVSSHFGYRFWPFH